MAKRHSAVTFATVREIGRSLPGVEESTAYGSPALKVKGVLVACIAIHRSAEPNSLAVRVAFDHRAALLAEAPDVYYLTPHYDEYPFVLVRMGRVRPDALKDLLISAHRLASKSPKSRSRKPSRRV